MTISSSSAISQSIAQTASTSNIVNLTPGKTTVATPEPSRVAGSDKVTISPAAQQAALNDSEASSTDASADTVSSSVSEQSESVTYSNRS